MIFAKSLLGGVAAVVAMWAIVLVVFMRASVGLQKDTAQRSLVLWPEGGVTSSINRQSSASSRPHSVLASTSLHVFQSEYNPGGVAISLSDPVLSAIAWFRHLNPFGESRREHCVAGVHG